MTNAILSVRGLTTRIRTPGGRVNAIEDVSFELAAGRTLGLVGESGSGKSVTLRSLIRLMPDGVDLGGEVRWQGRDLMRLRPGELRRVRGREIAMIFQEPMSALNPVLRIGRQIDETLRAHTRLDRGARRRRAVKLLAQTGIAAPERRLDDYPHQFSGGMRQRAMIAIALAASPALLLADEPTTALDVTIQDQILHLLAELQARLGMGMILVTHDLAVVAQSCADVAVMYAGRIVERGPVREVFARPRHAYTLGLLRSVPQPGMARRPLLSIEGTPPPLNARPTGCAFHPRCGFATARCQAERPVLEPASGDHAAACWHADQVAAAQAREAA